MPPSAREKGLAPLAELLLAQGRDCPDAGGRRPQGFIDPEKGVETAADALQGANDIIAELLSDDAAIRKTLRELLLRQGRLSQPAPPGRRTPSTGCTTTSSSPLPKLAGPPDPGHQPGREGGRPLRHGAAGPGGGAHRRCAGRW